MCPPFTVQKFSQAYKRHPLYPPQQSMLKGAQSTPTIDEEEQGPNHGKHVRCVVCCVFGVHRTCVTQGQMQGECMHSFSTIFSANWQGCKEPPSRRREPEENQKEARKKLWTLPCHPNPPEPGLHMARAAARPKNAPNAWILMLPPISSALNSSKTRCCAWGDNKYAWDLNEIPGDMS